MKCPNFTPGNYVSARARRAFFLGLHNAVALGLLGACCLVPPAAFAQYAPYAPPIDTGTDTPLKNLTVLVGGSVTHDSNLFRSPGLTGIGPQSDTISTAYVGLRLDQPYGLQRFTLDLTQSYNRYDRFSYLDYEPLTYGGAWLWQLGTRLSGRLGVTRSETQSFENQLSPLRNVRINQTEAFDLDAWMLDGWHLLLGVGQSDQKSERNLLNREPDFSSTFASVGVKYVTGAGNDITLRRQRSDGEYNNRPLGSIDNGYTETFTDLGVVWRPSGSSTLNARLGWLNRSQNDITLRDFSGPSSSLSYNWAPAGNLSLNISAARRTSPLQSVTATYLQSDTLDVQPIWRIGQKISAYLRLSYQRASDEDVLVSLPTGPRVDTTNSATLGLSWLAMRRLSLNASLLHTQRTSTVILSEYDATVARIDASLAF